MAVLCFSRALHNFRVILRGDCADLLNKGHFFTLAHILTPTLDTITAPTSMRALLLLVVSACLATAFLQPHFSSFEGRSIHSRSIRRGGLIVAAADSVYGESSEELEKLRFLTPELVEAVANEFGTPTYVYDMSTLTASAKQALAFPNAFGLTVRYAMKASPNAAILKLFNSLGLHVDASSGYEIKRAMRAGVPPSHISLSSQELPSDFDEYVAQGVQINACSISQLKRFGQKCPGGKVGLRFNPGVGSGGTGKTNVGGPSSAFGIWHELLPEVKAVVATHDLEVVRIHTHIGSGSDPAVWQNVATLSLDLVREFPKVMTLNLGGGYKVGRMSYEASTDLLKIGAPVQKKFEDFAQETGRKLHLEVEPGTFLVANAGALVCAIQDKTTTSAHTFLKLDAGMTEVLRPSLYGAQHPLIVIPKDKTRAEQTASYVVVGHCCESGDLLTPAPGEADTIAERKMTVADIGDLVVVEGSGAYCAGMSTKNYNSFPEAPEVMYASGGIFHLIRRRQTLDQTLQNELDLPASALS